VIEQLDGLLSQRGIGRGRRDNQRQFTHVLDRFATEFDRRWPRHHVATHYTELLTDERCLREVAAPTDVDWRLLQDDPMRLRSEDLVPLAYLSYLIDGNIPTRPPGRGDLVWPRLDHIVIDEAQDLPPLALSLLRVHAESLTVLGDMNQTVYAHRGSRSWSEVIKALGRDARQMHTLSVSYRSTRPISDLANHVVRVGGLGGGVSRPFQRTGPPPVLQGESSQVKLIDRVRRFVLESVDEGAPTVAIMTRSAARARAIFAAIEGTLPAPGVCVTDRLDDRDAPIVVMPAYLAKGLEFDAVAVVDVDAETFARTPNDAAILYVAMTRALNRLLVTWHGMPSPLIAGC
jgi:DNA helicase II / ATP-dependent DNA helicase PcrA